MDIVKARGELVLGKTIYDMNLRAVDYGRVSTDKDDQINSLENQVNYFNDMIDDIKSWTHVGSYVDEGISGTQVRKRDDFLRMIEDARLGKFDVILTKEVSRFARNTIDSISYTQLLLKYGVVVIFISDNINTIYPDSEFRLTLMASMAQDEVRKLSERVKFGVKRSIKDGKLGGGGLTGYYKKDGKLVINEKEAPMIRMLYSLYASGEYGFRIIGEKLAEAGYYTKKGKIYSDASLKRMLSNPRYKGYYTANLSEVEDYKIHKKKKKPKEEWVVYKDEKGIVPAIVSEELWDKANSIYEERTKHWNSTVLNKEYYNQHKTFTSKLFCMEHNTTFIRTASCKHKEKPVWRCNEYLRHGIKGCATPILYESHLNKIFTKVLSRFIDDKDKIFNDIINGYKKIIKESNSNINVESIEQQIKEQETFRERLLDMSLKRMISDDEFLEKNNKILSEIKELRSQKRKLDNCKEDDAYYQNIIDEIEKELEPKMDLENNLGQYFNLFVDKVFISKINNDRKHIKLDIIFNFKNPNTTIEVDLNDIQGNGKNKTSKGEYVKDTIPLNRTNRTYYKKVSFDNNFLKQKYLLLTSNEPRFCCFRSKAW